MMHTLLIRVGIQDKQQLEAEARRQHVSRSALARRAIDEYLASQMRAVVLEIPDNENRLLVREADRRREPVETIVRQALYAYLVRRRAKRSSRKTSQKEVTQP